MRRIKGCEKRFAISIIVYYTVSIRGDRNFIRSVLNWQMMPYRS